MDPNATLKELLELVNSDLAPDFVDEIVDRVEALDQWLSHGGFLPDRWSNNG